MNDDRCNWCGLLVRLRPHIRWSRCPECRKAMSATHCPFHEAPLEVCPDSGEWYCRECSLEAARRAYQQATDEALATLADGPERIDWHQCEQEPPF